MGHRVVAGGELLQGCLGRWRSPSKSRRIVFVSTSSILQMQLEFVPLERFVGAVTSVVVFDTSFQPQPCRAYRYPLPTKHYTENKVRKYGAHGTSHQYVAGETAKLLGKPLEELKLITCHVGNGVSVTAVDRVSVDTSMGFTPSRWSHDGEPGLGISISDYSLLDGTYRGFQ